MINLEFKPSPRGHKHYRIIVSCGVENANDYRFGLATKASLDAVTTALRASLKDSYELTIVPLGEFRGFYEWENLESACVTLERLRFVEYTTKDVEKVVIVKETTTRVL